jgi:hypothetical protein
MKRITKITEMNINYVYQQDESIIKVEKLEAGDIWFYMLDKHNLAQYGNKLFVLPWVENDKKLYELGPVENYPEYFL